MMPDLTVMPSDVPTGFAEMTTVFPDMTTVFPDMTTMLPDMSTIIPDLTTTLMPETTTEAEDVSNWLSRLLLQVCLFDLVLSLFYSFLNFCADQERQDDLTVVFYSASLSHLYIYLVVPGCVQSRRSGAQGTVGPV